MFYAYLVNTKTSKKNLFDNFVCVWACVGVCNLWQIGNITYANVRTCSRQKHGIGVQKFRLRVCVCAICGANLNIIIWLYGLIAVAAEKRRQMLPIHVYIWHIVIGVGNMCRTAFFNVACFLSVTFIYVFLLLFCFNACVWLWVWVCMLCCVLALKSRANVWFDFRTYSSVWAGLPLRQADLPDYFLLCNFFELNLDALKRNGTTKWAASEQRLGEIMK